jgi:hypothetical protein
MKTVSQIQSVSDIKGMHSIGARSIPKALRSDYLELYVLDRERNRLEKERYATDKRRDNVQKRLDRLYLKMGNLLEEIKKQEKKSLKDTTKKGNPFATMPIKY